MLPIIARIKNSPLSLPILSGVLYILSQPPVGLFPLAYICLVPLFFSMDGDGGFRQPFLMGLVMGIAAYLGLIYWVIVAMNTYGGLSIPFALLALLLFVLYLSLYLGCFTWLMSLLKHRLAIPYYLSAPFLWVALRYLRGIVFTGFPWSFLAHSQYNFLPLVQIVVVTGTYFLSFLIVMANCVLYGMAARKNVPRIYMALFVLFVVASLCYGIVRLKEPIQGQTVTTSIIQGNIRQDLKFDQAYKDMIIRTYSGLTAREGQGSQLVIWPETAMPFLFLQDSASIPIRDLSRSLETHLLVGAIAKDGQDRFYNAAHIIGAKGEIEGTYLKEHLVPFGEFTPLTAYFPFLANVSVAVGDLASGPGHNPVMTNVGKIGILICYEGVFPKVAADTVRNGAEVLVNLTNDAWYGITSAPYQHFSSYIFRAVETDRYVLRAANTGISAIIDPRGRTTAETGLFEERVLRGVFCLRHGQTVYVHYGDYFVLLVFLCLCMLVVKGIVMHRRNNNHIN